MLLNFYINHIRTMILQNSLDSSLRQSQRARAIKRMIKDVKEPLLRQIQQVKARFHEKSNQTQAESADAQPRQNPNRPTPGDTLNSISSRSPSQKNIPPPPRILTQSSCEDYTQIQQEPFIGEWTLQKANTSVFQKTEEMASYYSKVFDRRVQFAKSKKMGGDSFKLEEKQVISEVYNSIGNLDDETVTFDAIHGFFEQCPLFYRIYNIHPNSLREVLSDSAHCFESKLTREQFMNLFLLNNRQNYEYETYIVDKTMQRCVLDDESWKDLKEIFELFDTFGNENIQLKQFLHKFKTSSRYNNLLEKEVIHFPAIQRSYSLKKILFEIEHKLQIGENYVKWEEIRSIIEHFRHIPEPTIDAIQQNRIRSAVITSSTNSYMLKPEILTHIKDVFSRCPKYCSDFVKITHFCSQMLESERTNAYLNEVVRKQPDTSTFKQLLTQLVNQPIKHLDLDEVLQWFSIRGLEGPSNLSTKEQKALSVQSSSSEEEVFKKTKRKDKLRKNIEKLQIKHFKTSSREITVLKEFNLSKKTTESIRDKKVQQMIEESQRKEAEEASKRFKANPIPASINNEKYQEYRNRMAQTKESILQKLNKSNEKQKLVLQYLQANTKLFQRPRSVEPEQRKQYVFKAEPIPWFVYSDLLDQINEKKEAKRKEIKKQNRLKYLKDWKNLPSFLMDNNLGQSAVVTNNQTQKTLFNELKLNQQVLKSPKSKVKKVPNFQLLQQQFLQELEYKKKHYKPTVVQQFNLSSPRIKENLEEKPKEKQESKENKTLKQSCSNHFIGSTLKFESLLKLNQEKKILEEIQRQQMLEKQLKMKKDRKLFAKLVKKQLSRELKKNKKLQSSKKSRVKSQEMDSKRQMTNMYQRVFSRPFLFQSCSSRFKNSSAEKRAETIQMAKAQESQIEFIEDCFSQQIQKMLKVQKDLGLSSASQKSL